MLEGLVDLLIIFLKTLWEFVLDIFYAIGNIFIDILSGLIMYVAVLLPEMKSGLIPPDFGEYAIVETINWIFPVGIALNAITLYVTSVTLYFTIGIITRWAKVTN